MCVRTLNCIALNVECFKAAIKTCFDTQTRVTGEDYGPAPDLDHANPQLREALTDWLSWLQRDIGFAGWRLDFVKG